MNKNLQALNNFIGYGNPKSPYWFIGIDEQGEFNINKENEELERLSVFIKYFLHSGQEPFSLYEKNFESCLSDIQINELRSKAEKDSTYNGIIEIYNSLNNTNFTGSYVGNESLNLFSSNLFPIGRNNTKQKNYGPFVEKYFNLKNFPSWYNAYWCSRKNAFADFFKNQGVLNSPTIFICFGVSYQSYFEDLFEKIFNKDKVNLKFCKSINLTNQQQAILSYHPSKQNRGRYFTKDFINCLVEEIQKSDLLNN